MLLGYPICTHLLLVFLIMLKKLIVSGAFAVYFYLFRGYSITEQRNHPTDFPKNYTEFPASKSKPTGEIESSLKNKIIDCDGYLTLRNFTAHDSLTNKQIFFTHTSPKSKGFSLSGRQLCAIESAARKSGLHVNVLTRADSLKLSKYPGLCEILNKLRNKISFYTIHFEELFSNTPLEQDIERYFKYAPDMFLGNWLSDLLRSPLVYKYGGLYADLDVLFLKDLNSFVDTVPINAMYDKPKPKDCQLPEGTEKKASGATKRQGSYQLSSSQFHLSKGIAQIFLLGHKVI